MMQFAHTYLTDVSHVQSILGYIDVNHLSIGHLHLPGVDDWAVLAQQFKETDISGDVGKVWAKAVKQGQVWAFLLGAIFGYLVKTFTTYG
jgi:hypothetical protein